MNHDIAYTTNLCVCRNTSKKYSIMAFNSGDKVNCSSWTQARMERDMSNRRMYGVEETEEGAAGSEFGKKQREEARRKKFGIVTREFKVEDQPWILKVNGKAGKRFKGTKKGGITENASYYIFTQCPDGAFEAFPVNGWYNFVPQAKHRTLTAEEAEEECGGTRNKVVNHFSIMLQRRLREQERGPDDDDEEGEKGGKKKKKKGGRGGDLRIHDLEDDLELSSDESDSNGDSKPKKKEGDVKGKVKKKKKKKRGSDSEANEDSDDGDFEGLEVDYMSDESRTLTLFTGIDEASESEEESEEEKQNEEEGKEEEEEEEGKKTPVQTKKKRDSSGESDTSEDSDIDGEAASALFMKKRTPPKRGGGRGSGGSSRTGSRPGTPSIDSASTSNTLRAAASKLEQGTHTRMHSHTHSQMGNRFLYFDVQLTEEAVRRYLIRKPMTTKDLLKKFQTKRTGLSSEQTVNVLAQILKRLNPERKNVNDKMHFYLTE
uniref:Transcription initiation factor IIF subunit alpha n=1 Tax=Oncorhynchus mykiss TaxID=8022 RepID=A0A8C7NNN6_ONCMY